MFSEYSGWQGSWDFRVWRNIVGFSALHNNVSQTIFCFRVRCLRGGSLSPVLTNSRRSCSHTVGADDRFGYRIMNMARRHVASYVAAMHGYYRGHPPPRPSTRVGAELGPLCSTNSSRVDQTTQQTKYDNVIGNGNVRWGGKGGGSSSRKSSKRI